MKLRIHGDSIRLRLRKSEVRQLLDQGILAERTAFSTESEFRCVIEIAGEKVSATCGFCEMKIYLPHALAERWAATDQVGIDADQPVGNNRTLRILIEKDFACRDARGDESQEDAFENPAGVRC